MLILERKPGEKIRIGRDIAVWVSSVRGKRVRIAIEAPREVEIHCEEVAREIERQVIGAPS